MTPNERLDDLVDELEEAFEDNELELSLNRFREELTITVEADKLVQVATLLRDHKALEFEQCIDVCGVDYSDYGKTEWATKMASSEGFGRGVDRDAVAEFDPATRFAVVYHLLSVSNNQRLRMRVFLDEHKPIVDSLISVWNGVNWFEREAFDLFGIMFRGHPDLRRILTDYGFIGHPFRKDFPLSGHVEMRYDAEQARVVYEPVSIDPRTLVPRVIREDNRYVTDAAPEAAAEDNPDA
ncbi:MAG: NADH-quinone oxidoreductase subunit C [Chromatiales bacterium]|jgi:NADH-quinone oxidoreductase subunit C